MINQRYNLKIRLSKERQSHPVIQLDAIKRDSLPILKKREKSISIPLKKFSKIQILSELDRKQIQKLRFEAKGAHWLTVDRKKSLGSISHACKKCKTIENEKENEQALNLIYLKNKYNSLKRNTKMAKQRMELHTIVKAAFHELARNEQQMLRVEEQPIGGFY